MLSEHKQLMPCEGSGAAPGVGEEHPAHVATGGSAHQVPGVRAWGRQPAHHTREEGGARPGD